MEALLPRAHCPDPGLAVFACVEVGCGMEGMVSLNVVGKPVGHDRVERWLRAMQGAAIGEQGAAARCFSSPRPTLRFMPEFMYAHVTATNRNH